MDTTITKQSQPTYTKTGFHGWHEGEYLNISVRNSVNLTLTWVLNDGSERVVTWNLRNNKLPDMSITQSLLLYIEFILGIGAMYSLVSNELTPVLDLYINFNQPNLDTDTLVWNRNTGWNI